MSKYDRPVKTILGMPVKIYDWMPDDEVAIVKQGRAIETIDRKGRLMDYKIVEEPQIIKLKLDSDAK